MTIEMVKTSDMLKVYLEENNLTLNDLLKVTDTSSATLYNFFFIIFLLVEGNSLIR